MPYSLYELNKMSKEQLENLANELNIKGAKKMDSESLAFAILDTQAQAESLKTSQEKTTRKRGRPRKATKWQKVLKKLKTRALRLQRNPAHAKNPTPLPRLCL